MKKYSLIMIIVWSFIGLTIIAALMAGTIFFNRGGRGSVVMFGGLGESELVADEIIPIKDIERIEFYLASDRCNVHFADDESIIVKHYARNIPESRHAKVKVSGTTLTVSTMPQGFGGFTLFGFSNKSVVEIALPKSYKESLDIDLKSGDISFDGDLDLSELMVQLSSGNVNFDGEVAADGLSVTVSSGTVRAVNAIKAKNADIHVTSGTVKAQGGLTANNYTLKTSSGDIIVGERLAGSGNINVTSGSIKLEGVDIAESLSAKTSSGTINIGMAGNPSLNFTGRKSSGTIRAYFPIPQDGKVVAATVGEAPYKNLDVSVTSGTIRITQE